MTDEEWRKPPEYGCPWPLPKIPDGISEKIRKAVEEVIPCVGDELEVAVDEQGVAYIQITKVAPGYAKAIEVKVDFVKKP